MALKITIMQAEEIIALWNWKNVYLLYKSGEIGYKVNLLLQYIAVVDSTALRG